EQAMQGCVRCKNVDMVWQTIQGKLGLRDEAATKVWDTTQKKWRLFTEVYPSALPLQPRVLQDQRLSRFPTLDSFEQWLTTSASPEEKISFLDRGAVRAATTFIVIHDGGMYSYDSLLNDWVKRNVDFSSYPECSPILNEYSTADKTRRGDLRGQYPLCFSMEVSSHYHIDCDGAVVQIIPDTLAASHAGCSGTDQDCYIPTVNLYSIGVDLRDCSAEKNVYATREQYERLSRLLTELAVKYNIPRDDDHIIGHFEVGKHGDPQKSFDWTQIGLQDHRRNGYCCRHRDEANCRAFVQAAGQGEWTC
ncbi:MAG: peptidoglycan recognition family protein, partial [Nanoarchaeota archaeon]